MSAELIGSPSLVERSKCALCEGNYLLRGEKYAQLIELQEMINVKMICAGCKKPSDDCRCSVRDLQRTCFSIVPLADCIFVCMPCWRSHCDDELRNYAHAPFAAEMKGISIG